MSKNDFRNQCLARMAQSLGGCDPDIVAHAAGDFRFYATGAHDPDILDRAMCRAIANARALQAQRRRGNSVEIDQHGVTLRGKEIG